MIRPARLLERLLGDVAAWAETREDRLDIELFASERESLGDAVEKRRREFMSGRACAREALARLGAPVAAIPSGPRGEPRWPAGVVGSITHCAGYRGCAVARSDAVAALGIDAEPDEPLPAGVLDEVVQGDERERLAVASPVDLGRLAFSAKEAVFKAWFPLTGRWLDFHDAELRLDLAGRAFRADLRVPGPRVDDVELTGFDGRWCVEGGVIVTAVVVPTGAGSALLPRR
jgi:4'-phosphopantetheinyl transferase EntD